jgi:hypothetical protein
VRSSQRQENAEAFRALDDGRKNRGGLCGGEPGRLPALRPESAVVRARSYGPLEVLNA